MSVTVAQLCNLLRHAIEFGDPTLDHQFTKFNPPPILLAIQYAYFQLLQCEVMSVTVAQLCNLLRHAIEFGDPTLDHQFTKFNPPPILLAIQYIG